MDAILKLDQVLVLVSFFQRIYDHREGPEYIDVLKVQPQKRCSV